MIAQILISGFLTVLLIMQICLNTTLPNETKVYLTCISLFHFLSLSILCCVVINKSSKSKTQTILYHLYLVILEHSFGFLIILVTHIFFLIFNIWVIVTTPNGHIYGITIQIMIFANIAIVYYLRKDLQQRQPPRDISSSQVEVIILQFLFLFIKIIVEPLCSVRQFNIVGISFLFLTSVVIKNKIYRKSELYLILLIFLQGMNAYQFIRQLFPSKQLYTRDYFLLAIYSGIFIVQFFEIILKNRARQFFKVIDSVKKIKKNAQLVKKKLLNQRNQEFYQEQSCLFCLIQEIQRRPQFQFSIEGEKIQK